MNTKHSLSCLLFCVSVATSAQAQTHFFEVEPNGTKGEATLAAGMVSGDVLNGTTTGASTTAGATASTTADTWRVRTGALPAGIYRHTLVITTSGATGHTSSLRGVNQQNGVPGTVDSGVQFSSSFTAVPYSSTWYGFGKQEHLHWRIEGTAATTGTYKATLSTVAVTPILVPGTFNPGQIVISTFMQGHTSDTELYLYDAGLNPVPLGHNDGTLTSGFANSILTMPSLAAGTYYLAVGQYNTANNQSDLNPDEQYDDDALLEFPDVISSSGTTTSLDVAFSISDGATSTYQPATKVNAFDIVWARFTVGTPATPSTVYCSGDGSGTACPCANAGLPGNGCASSIAPGGAHLGGSGLASLTNDTFVLTGLSLPNSSALYFQGTTRTAAGAGAHFGDGLRCASGTIARLGLKTSAGGASSYPAAGDIPISIRGNNVAGGVRTYQIWYRNAASFCTASTFNLSNGLELVWSP